MEIGAVLYLQFIPTRYLVDANDTTKVKSSHINIAAQEELLKEINHFCPYLFLGLGRVCHYHPAGMTQNMCPYTAEAIMQVESQVSQKKSADLQMPYIILEHNVGSCVIGHPHQ
jgi:hypothetical protein